MGWSCEQTDPTRLGLETLSILRATWIESPVCTPTAVTLGWCVMSMFYLFSIVPSPSLVVGICVVC